MRFSIAMTTYNGERYLEAQLDSFRQQTVLPDEIVVCDDGSIDHTMDILGRFARAAPFPVHVHRNSRRLGYTANFGRAIRKAQGDVILLSDQDDFWLPNKIQVVGETFKTTTGVSVVINDAELTDGTLRPLGVTKLGQTLSAGLGSESFITGCCTTLSAALCPLLFPIPKDHFVHDAWIHAIGRTLGCRQIVRRTLQYYRRHGQNVSQALTSRITPVSSRDVMKYYGLKDSRLACAERLACLKILRERLVERRLEAERLVGQVGLESALCRLERERSVVQGRARLLETSRFVRPLAAWRLFQGGGYEYFSGWRSLAKDLIQ